MRRSLLLAVLVLTGCGLSPEDGLNRQPNGLGSGPSVTPTVVAGNPTCADLGLGSFEYKIDNVSGPFTGTYTSADGYLTVTATSTDGVHVDWTANHPVAAVLVKGGPMANEYVYSPPSSGDSNQTPPINSNNGTPYAISHVNFCYDYILEVSKTAATSLTRTHSWTVSKTANQSALTLSAGQQFNVSYAVTVTNSSTVDSNHAVSGVITIHNAAPQAAMITSVTDAMGSISGTVDCGMSFPIQLAGGATKTCSYSAALPDASDRTNVATVATSGLVKGSEGQAAVSFAAPAITTIDGCVDATDSLTGVLGTVCAAQSPKTFSYGMFVGSGQCGPQSVINTATITAASGATSSASWTVALDIPCALGCTLTQGYWKTHSAAGPAPYDDTWALLAQGGNTPFLTTGKSWYQLFWTPPAGDAYVQLAHQYMAARLNELNGASTTAVATQLAQAQSLLTQYANTTLTKTQKNAFTSLVGSLDAYNKGVTGPGHCAE